MYCILIYHTSIILDILYSWWKWIPRWVLGRYFYEKRGEPLKDGMRYHCEEKQKKGCKVFLDIIGYTVTVNHEHNHGNESINLFSLVKEKSVYVRYKK